jgi:hypothetical protein
MATRIESGRMQIAGVGGVPMQRVNQPGVDYIGPRAEAQAAGSLAQVLDRMSQYAFGEAKRQRADEGLQYAANNPPTAEQLEAAKNGDPSSLIPQGNSTYFDQAVRKARSFELSAHFEIEGRNELAKLLSDVEAGTATSEQVEARITTLTEGFAKSLSKVEPEAALKFRATMATHGNTVLNAAYSAEVKRAKEQRRAKFDMDFDNGVRLLETTVTQHPEKLAAMADVFRTNVNTQALLLGDAALQKEYSTKFEVALRGAKINALTKEFASEAYMGDLVTTLQKIRMGDAGRLSPVLQDLITNDFDAVAKVTANVMAAQNQRDAAEKAKREDEKRKDFAEFLPLYDQAVAAPEGSAQRKRLTDQIAQIAMRDSGAVPLSVIKDLREPSKEGNAMVEFNVLNGIYSGTITSNDEIYKTPGLNGKQKVSLLKTLNSENRRDQSELDRGMARLAGIPVQPGQVVVLDPKGAEFQRLQELRADALDIEAAATREGKVITPRQVLLQLEKDIEAKRSTQAAESAKDTLKTVYEKKAWINGPITPESLSALERKAGNDKNKLADLRRIKVLLEQSQGKTNGAQ